MSENLSDRGAYIFGVIAGIGAIILGAFGSDWFLRKDILIVIGLIFAGTSLFGLLKKK